MVTITEHNTRQVNKWPKEKADAEIKKARKEGEKMIKGMFEFIDAQGGWFDFVYRWFPGQPIMTVRLTHGEICDLPLDLVKHLNNTKKKVRRLDMVQLSDRGIPKTYETTSRVRFTPMDVII